MSITSDDLEDYTEKFRDMLYRQNDQKINLNDMWCLIENLTKEIEVSKGHGNTLQNNLRLCLENDDANITTKYVTLREKYDKNENENIDLKHQLKNLQVQMEMDLELQKNEYINKMTELEKNYKCEIIRLKNQLESDRICYETKEKELYNDLQLAQASTALQCDEIESNLKRQLVDSNNKLRQSQNIIRTLQMDINNLRNQLASQQFTTSPQKLQKSVLRYQPLPLTRSTNICEDSEDVGFEAPIVRNTPQLIFKGINTPRRKQNIPPLKQCSDAGIENGKSLQKKRKLYNPEDTDYLQKLEEIK